MAEDLNTDQAVIDQDLNNADAVNQQDLNTDQTVTDQNQDAKLADGTTADKTVKYSEFQKANEAKKVAEEQTAYAQRQLELMQANTATQTQQAPVKQAGSTYEQAMLDCGLTPDDLYGENMIKVQNRKAQIDTAIMQQNNAVSSSSQFMIAHPDAAQVVGTVNPATGQIVAPSRELMEFLAKKPGYASACTPQVAYDLIMRERELIELKKLQSTNQEHRNRQNIDNASQPLGGSAAGGSGAGDVNGQQMMTREQVLEIERKLANGERV